MNKIKEIIYKLKKTFSNFFNKNDKLLICDTKEVFLESVEEKDDFLEIYENVKNGLISLDSLMVSDLIKVQTLLIEESQIYGEKINEKRCELINLKAKKEKLINEKKGLEDV